MFNIVTSRERKSETPAKIRRKDYHFEGEEKVAEPSLQRHITTWPVCNWCTLLNTWYIYSINPVISFISLQGTFHFLPKLINDYSVFD